MPPDMPALFSQYFAYGSFTAIYAAGYSSDKVSGSMSDLTWEMSIGNHKFRLYM